jgi:Zn-dependent peptidase ImmA (M78 family)
MFCDDPVPGLMSPELSTSAQRALDHFQRYLYDRFQEGPSARPGRGKSTIQGVAELIAQQVSPPNRRVDPEVAARLLAIEIRYREDRRPDCGMITPQGSSLVATVGGNPRSFLSRFAVAHECGHACFYRMGVRSRERIIPPSLRLDTVASDREEFLADAFAAALLLPSPLVLAQISEPPHLGELRRLARFAGVSFEVAIRRAVLDLRLGEGSSWYQIKRQRAGVQASTLRRRRDQGTPSQGELTSVLRGAGPLREEGRFRALLSTEFPTIGSEFVVDGNRVWLRLTPSGRGGENSAE